MIDDRGEDFRRDRQLLETRLRELGIPSVDADSLIPAARWPRLRYPRDTHWNAAGHEEMGRALAPRIRPLLATLPAPRRPSPVERKFVDPMEAPAGQQAFGIGAVQGGPDGVAVERPRQQEVSGSGR